MLYNFQIVLIYLYTIIRFSVCINSCSLYDVHAVILARGGSKGITNKNLLQLDGHSILARTILTIQKSGMFNYTWVSTDSEAIAAEALSYGAFVHKRAAQYAEDGTTSLQSIQEFLNGHLTIERFALFQCTSIFLEARYIREAVQLFQGCDCVFSVTRTHNLRWDEVNGTIVPLNFNPMLRPRRQDWNGELFENGMFYFSSRTLIEQGRFQNERCSVVKINNIDSIEIDTLDDVFMARCLLDMKRIQNK